MIGSWLAVHHVTASHPQLPCDAGAVRWPTDWMMEIPSWNDTVRYSIITIWRRLLIPLLPNFPRKSVLQPIISQQVKALIGDGNQVYVDNDSAEAIRIMQEVIPTYSDRTSKQRSMFCARSVLWRYERIAKSLAVEDYGSLFEEWDRLARESKYEPFGAKISYARLKYYLQYRGHGYCTTNKRCIVTERFTVWIHPMLTRYRIEDFRTVRPSLRSM